MKHLRKNNRLPKYDYSKVGAYFLTICVKDMRCILSSINVGSDALDAPIIRLTRYGEIVNNEIRKMNEIYNHLNVEYYVIMPNHIHMILVINEQNTPCGASRASLPTAKSEVAKYVGTLKRFCNKQFEQNIWQTSYYDHIIRNKNDYLLHIQYIEENPKKWVIGKDKYYV